MLTGPVMDPRVAHELYLRMDHLGIRMSAHSKTAQFLAEKMKEDGLKVIYPGLKDHPQYKTLQELSGKEMAGGILTLECTDADAARILATKLQDEKFGLYAVSLGFSRTLMSVSAKSTSSEIPEDERAKMGLAEGLLRFSIGYSGDPEIMWERFKKCYEA